MTAPAYSLQVIAGKFEGQVFPLTFEGDVVVGRSDEADVSLPEDMVSRKHAKLTAAATGLVIQDLGSTNGTFVNGEKVSKVVLQAGDQLLIGGSILKVVPAAGASFEPRLSEPTADDTEGPIVPDTGSLTDCSVRELLQLLSAAERSTVLAVSHDEQDGRIYLRRGRIFYACVGDDHELGPMKAMGRIMAWPNGTFELAPLSDDTEFLLELEDSTSDLLREADARVLAYREALVALPPLHARLRIPRPLAMSLRDLDAEELDLLQLAHNEGVLRAVLDHSPTGDRETADIVTALLERGFLEAME